MTGSPYEHEWTAEQRARIEDRNLATATRLELIDLLAVNEQHAKRAKVRTAALYPPTGPAPAAADVEAAVAATAPPNPDEEPLA